MVSPDLPVFSSVSDVDVLRADLVAARFTFDAVVALVGEDAMDALVREQPAAARWAVEQARAAGAPTAGTDAGLAALVWVFVLGGVVESAELSAAMPGVGVEGLMRLGLVEPAPGGGVRAAVDLRPHAADDGLELWVASDVGAHHREGVLRKDHVLGIGQASLTLAANTVRRDVDTALDVGVGCGIQTFHLLRHAGHVTATDLSERALAFTRFNALLNYEQLAIDPADMDARLTLLQGSLLEPVAGRQFDVVVSNPPFVITPRTVGESEEDRFTYRDGGLPGDQLVETLWRGLGDVLAPGGTAQMLANWEIPSGAHWAQRLDEWTPQGLEAWVIQRDVESPADYAQMWLRDASEDRDPVAAQRRFGEYLEDFASRDVEGVGFGYVWLRRPEVGRAHGVGRVFEEVLREVDSPLGPWLKREIDAADALVGLDVASARAVVAEDVTTETYGRPLDPHPQMIVLRQGSGLRRTHALTTEQAGLVSACDGDVPVGALAAAVVELMTDDALDADADADAAAGQHGTQRQVRDLVDFAATLVRQGLLVIE
ncbi:hypothetical protein HMPREF3160_04240 [Arthrobacter sp. HMSC06H05]|uniref:DUF7059 domain-containing protein n=1 Tax=Arthrobacter sp. HMSC06H05 TaxID=1581128 RepID=UPI0008A29360|nr:methyltransferase [Arthrobacter sp. HMSC06H05]OFT42936.1 hypothetical protein HMPREF3160_04240 [Arthrobacter sp. HMSC06H05]